MKSVETDTCSYFAMEMSDSIVKLLFVMNFMVILSPNFIGFTMGGLHVHPCRIALDHARAPPDLGVILILMNAAPFLLSSFQS